MFDELSERYAHISIQLQQSHHTILPTKHQNNQQTTTAIVTLQAAETLGDDGKDNGVRCAVLSCACVRTDGHGDRPNSISNRITPTLHYKNKLHSVTKQQQQQ
jgi:hypothetical protein